MTRPALKTGSMPALQSLPKHPVPRPLAWRRLPAPGAEQGNPVRGIAVALLLSSLFWVALAAMI